MKILLLLLFLSCGIQFSRSVPWLPPCPLECWCHEANLASVWDPLPDETSGENSGQVLAAHPNEVLNPAKKEQQRAKPVINHILESGSLKTAICVQQKNTNIESLVARIPPQTEALRIIQAPDAASVVLGSSHFRQFSGLRALVLEGSIRSSEGNFTLAMLPEAWEHLENLEYLSVRDVDLNPEQRETVHDKEAAEEKEAIEYNTILNITFDTLDYEIVSYEVFKTREKAEQEFQQQWDGFVKLQKLRKLHIFRSRVPESFTSPASHTFSDLPDLVELVIEQCSLKSLVGWSKNAANLKILSLEANEILDVDPEYLNNLKKLEYLDLSNNNVTHVTEKSFQGLDDLAYLNLRNNPLESIYPLAFANLGNLKVLHLDENPGKLQLYPDSFKGLKKLEQLWLTADFSNLVETETTESLFEETKSLRQLHLRGNLSYLPADVFVNLKKLVKLNLQNCNLEKVSVDAFQGLQRLHVLNLSHNKLNFILPGVFDSLSGLRELWLNHNLLTTLPKNVFANLPSKLIRLDHNPWHCDCRLDQLNPTSVNKVRVHANSPQKRTTYTYDRNVSPRCSTPKIYETWSVFDVLRKELKCKKLNAGKRKLNTESNLTKDRPKKKIGKEFDYPIETVFEFYEDPDVIDHGPEADTEDDTAESVPSEASPVSKEENTEEEDEHGPEAVEEVTTTMATVLKNPKIELPLLKTTPSMNKEKNHLQSVILESVKENPYYSATLSKKSLKLLMEDEKTKAKESKNFLKKLNNNISF